MGRSGTCRVGTRKSSFPHPTRAHGLHPTCQCGRSTYASPNVPGLEVSVTTGDAPHWPQGWKRTSASTCGSPGLTSPGPSWPILTLVPNFLEKLLLQVCRHAAPHPSTLAPLCRVMFTHQPALSWKIHTPTPTHPRPWADTLQCRRVCAEIPTCQAYVSLGLSTLGPSPSQCTSL